MRLFIAEKPSLGKAIAEQLPKPHKRGDGFIQCGGGDVVTWAFGHLFELAEPENYDPALKSWNFAQLPFVPEKWKLLPTRDGRKQLKVIKELLAKAETIVNAGDPDREGELLIREILDACRNKKPVQRIWLSALDPASVKKALGSMGDNRKQDTLYYSALARQRADWLVGMNLTRAYTIAGRTKGNSSLLSVGRVQTPTLALVVKRDLEIEQFKPTDYFVPTATVDHENGTFRATWKPAGDQPGLDAEGRLVDAGVAERLAIKVKGQPGRIAHFESKLQREAPRKLFALSDLQVEASRRFGMSAQTVLNAAQALYERHKLTSYPRTDCAFLPESQLADAPEVLAAVTSNAAHLAPAIKTANPKQKSAAWNDAKVTAHHAIIPTVQRANLSALSEVERKIYDLICRSYVAQFMADHTYQQSSVVVEIVGEKFTATGRVTVKPGWRVLFGKDAEADTGKAAGEAQEGRQNLPRMATGDRVTCSDCVAEAKRTKPPAHYTDGTLIAAMTNIHKLVTNPEVKKRLRESDGIGTEATRASMIEKLLKRGFLEKNGKYLISTTIGRNLIAALPDTITEPDLTAYFEYGMAAVEAGTVGLEGFLTKQVDFVSKLVERAREGDFSVPAGAPAAAGHKCPVCQQGVLSRRKGKKGAFWGCSRYPDCKTTFPDKRGKPDMSARKRETA